MKFELTDVKEHSFYALETLKDSWVLTAKQFFPLFIGWFLTLGGPLLAACILSALGFGIDKVVFHLPKGGLFTVFGLMVGVFAIGGFWAGWAKIALKVVRGIPTKMGDVLCSPGQMLSGLIALSLSTIAIGLTSWLVIPGALLFLKWQLTPYYIVDQNCGPIEALKRSWHATDNAIFIPLAVLDLIFFGLSTASGCLIVGPIICHMALAVASALVYTRWLTDEHAPFKKTDLIDEHDAAKHSITGK